MRSAYGGGGGWQVFFVSPGSHERPAQHRGNSAPHCPPAGVQTPPSLPSAPESTTPPDDELLDPPEEEEEDDDDPARLTVYSIDGGLSVGPPLPS